VRAATLPLAAQPQREAERVVAAQGAGRQKRQVWVKAGYFSGHLLRGSVFSCREKGEGVRCQGGERAPRKESKPRLCTFEGTGGHRPSEKRGTAA